MICYLLSVAVPNIKAAIALTGATFNPLTGFLFPVFFSLKLDPAPWYTTKKLFSLFMLAFFSLSSVLGLFLFYKQYIITS
jgi:Transmembrane amino acid transporter protein